jgi:hypothetical protein
MSDEAVTIDPFTIMSDEAVTIEPFTIMSDEAVIIAARGCYNYRFIT